MRIYKRGSQAKRWSCDQCTASFWRHATLQVHTRSHTGYRPYACEYCNNRFLLLSSLQSHVRSHSESPMIGTKRFVLQSKVDGSMFLSSKDRSYKCMLCFRLFPKRDATENHLKQFHRIYSDEVRSSNITSSLPPGVPLHDSSAWHDSEMVALENHRTDRETDQSEIGSDAHIENLSQPYDQENSPKSPQDHPPIDADGSRQLESYSGSDFRVVAHTDPVFEKTVTPASSSIQDDDPLESASSEDSNSELHTEEFEVSESHAKHSSSESPSPESEGHDEKRRSLRPRKDNQGESVYAEKRSDSEISDDEWAKLNQAYAKIRTQPPQIKEDSSENTQNSKTVAGSDDDEPPQNMEEDVSQQEGAVEGKSDTKDTDELRDTPFDAASYFKKSLKQFAEMENEISKSIKYDYPSQVYKGPSLKVEQLVASWNMSNQKTSGRKKGHRKKSFARSYKAKTFTSRAKNEKSALACPVCNTGFVEEADLKEHMARHEGTNTKFLKCSQCPKVFSSKHSLTHHEKIHSDYRPYHCTVCGKGFYQRANIKVHMRRHTGERPYKCNICGKAYSVKISLAAHSGSHAEENKYACKKCKFCFATPEELEDHQKVHAIQKSHECPKCKKSFLKAYLLEFHLQRGCEDKKFICEWCNKQFACLDYLKVHQRVHTGEKPFGCEVCGKFFSQSANLTKHLRIHNNIRPFSCDICQNTFVEKASMIAHRRTHTGEKPHMCDVCGVSFSSPSSLVIHLRNHTGEKPYACDMCDKRFNSSGKLRDHYRTHTGEKPFKCKFCDKSFALSNGLVRHTRTHTGERPHKCDFCGQRFQRKDRLRKHMTTHVETQLEHVEDMLPQQHYGNPVSSNMSSRHLTNNF